MEKLISTLSFLSVSNIANVTQLTVYELRTSLQEIVDKYNNISKMAMEIMNLKQ